MTGGKETTKHVLKESLLIITQYLLNSISSANVFSAPRRSQLRGTLLAVRTHTSWWRCVFVSRDRELANEKAAPSTQAAATTTTTVTT